MSDSTTPATEPQDVRPVVRTGSADNRALWIGGGILLISGLLLFEALSAHRENLAAPATEGAGGGAGAITAPPPLSLPPQFADQQVSQLPQYRRVEPIPVYPPASVPPQVITRVVERPVAVPPVSNNVPLQPAYTPQPQVVFASDTPVSPAAAVGPKENADRVEAGRLHNPSLTVPKGTVIAAVLETALDSTRAGAARAIVSRDVMGFDGTHVLIPRGSRLYGEYESDISLGQKRALIRWERLTRPDAVIIDLDSPSADPLGRAGVKGDVNSHFFSRFGSAILQSVLDIGVGLATRSAGNDVIVALPRGSQAVSNTLTPEQQIKPTLKIRQGTSVSVFVARDLDFSTVQQ